MHLETINDELQYNSNRSCACEGLSRHAVTSCVQSLELMRRGLARHHLVNSLNVTSRTQAHVVLLLTFTQVKTSGPPPWPTCHNNHGSYWHTDKQLSTTANVFKQFLSSNPQGRVGDVAFTEFIVQNREFRDRRQTNTVHVFTSPPLTSRRLRKSFPCLHVQIFFRSDRQTVSPLGALKCSGNYTHARR